MDKMREGKLWSFVHDSLHEAYKKLSTTGTRDEYYAMLDAVASKIADDIDSRFGQAAQSAAVPVLSVWYGEMPESNGKSNWTVLLCRDGDVGSGITIERSEYPDRVRYEADRVRFLIGEINEEPCILDYDAEKHSGYVKAEIAAVPVVGEPVAWRCKDFGDGWILEQIKDAASAYQSHTGCLMQELVVQPTTSITAAELDALRKDAEQHRWLREHIGMLASYAASMAAIAGEKK